MIVLVVILAMSQIVACGKKESAKEDVSTNQEASTEEATTKEGEFAKVEEEAKKLEEKAKTELEKLGKGAETEIGTLEVEIFEGFEDLKDKVVKDGKLTGEEIEKLFGEAKERTESLFKSHKEQ